MRTRSIKIVLLLVAVLAAIRGPAFAQVLNTGAQAIALNAKLDESLTLTLSANSVNFVLTAGSATNPGNTGVTATTTWTSKPGRNLSLYGYFFSSTAALTDGAGNNIPSADFEISDNGGAYAGLNNSVPFGAPGAGLQLFTMKITGRSKTGTHIDDLLFNINLSTIPQLPAGTYTGVLSVRAQII